MNISKVDLEKKYDLKIDSISLKKRKYNWDDSWFRLSFHLETNYYYHNLEKKISSFLENHCTDSFGFYDYSYYKNSKIEIMVVIFFKNKNDAILFKLEDRFYEILD